MMMMTTTTRVHTLFQTKHSRTLKGLSRTCISHFSRTPFSAKKSLEFLVLPQHEQFYPESTSVVAPFPLVWITLAPKFKDFPAKTAIFKNCQEAYELWTMMMMPITITITNNDDDYVFKRLFSLM